MAIILLVKPLIATEFSFILFQLTNSFQFSTHEIFVTYVIVEKHKFQLAALPLYKQL